MGAILVRRRRESVAVTNGATGSHPVDDCVPELVTRQAAVTPNAVAVDDGDEALTYSTLNARAGRLAARLRSLGVGTDVPVAILLPRSVGLVVAALGIMKAGGAYLPLDPSYPDARLVSVLRDARPPVVVTDERGTARLPAGDGLVVTVDALANANVQDDTLAAVSVAPSDL